MIRGDRRRHVDRCRKRRDHQQTAHKPMKSTPPQRQRAEQHRREHHGTGSTEQTERQHPGDSPHPCDPTRRPNANTRDPSPSLCTEDTTNTTTIPIVPDQLNSGSTVIQRIHARATTTTASPAMGPAHRNCRKPTPRVSTRATAVCIRINSGSSGPPPAAAATEQNNRTVDVRQRPAGPRSQPDCTPAGNSPPGPPGTPGLDCGARSPAHRMGSARPRRQTETPQGRSSASTSSRPASSKGGHAEY